MDWTLFRKPTSKTIDAITSDVKSNVTKSVGLIRLGEQALGTGFRVGKKLIMTNLHVVKPHLTGKSMWMRVSMHM